MNHKEKELFEALFVKYPALECCRSDIESAFEILAGCFASGGKLLLCGNGGSSADCGHIVGELMKGFLKRRPLEIGLVGAIGEAGAKLQRGLPAISLCAHEALISAVSNDLGGRLIFAQQVIGYARKGDVLLGISTSGNAENVLVAVRTARALGLKTIGLTGAGGGTLKAECDRAVCVPAEATAAVQEFHLPVYHALCAMLEERFFGGDESMENPI